MVRMIWFLSVVDERKFSESVQPLATCLRGWWDVRPPHHRSIFDRAHAVERGNDQHMTLAEHLALVDINGQHGIVFAKK